MNKKYLCALALFCTFSMNSLVAQNNEVIGAKLFINYQKNNNKSSNIYLSGEEAYQFDIADFLAKNKDESFSISGGAMVNYEKISWRFNTNDLEAGAANEEFSQVVTGIEKIPFMGISVKATEDFSGAEITRIVDGSSAEEIGFEVGDIITLIDDNEIANTCDLTSAINQSEIGATLTVDILRANKNTLFKPTMGYRLHKKLSWEATNEAVISLDNDQNTARLTDLSVYPNPTGGLVQFNYTATEQTTAQVTITDFMGRVVLSKVLTQFAGMNEEVLDLNKLEDDVYFLNVIQGEEIRTEKLILQKG